MLSLFTRRVASLLLFTLPSLFILSACGGAEEVEYVIGEPLTDSTLAAVVTSDFGADSLTAVMFNMALDRLERQQAPLLERLDAAEAEERREELRRQLLEQFVMSHLVQGKIEELGIEPQIDSAAVNQQVMRQMVMMQSRSNFDTLLAQRNLTEESLRMMFTQRIRAQMVAQQQQQMLIDSLTADVEEPTAAVLDTFIENRREEELRARHILFTVPPEADEAATDSIETIAATILDSALAGGDFAELARRHSEGPAGARGGDLGYFGRGDMVEPFEEAAFALQDSGEVYQELVQTRYGFHIIRLEDRRMAAAMDTAQARQMLFNQRKQEAIEEAIERLKARATVRINQAAVQTELNVPEEEEETASAP